MKHYFTKHTKEKRILFMEIAASLAIGTKSINCSQTSLRRLDPSHRYLADLVQTVN